jgi:hypothetical protein
MLDSECRGEDEAFSFVAAADDLKEQVGVAGVEGQVPDLVDHQERNAGVEAQASVETARRFLSSEVEQHLSRGEKKHGVAGDDGLVGDVLSNHRFAEPLGRDENDVSMIGEKVELDGGLDASAVDARGPVPVVVGDRFEDSGLLPIDLLVVMKLVAHERESISVRHIEDELGPAG